MHPVLKENEYILKETNLDIWNKNNYTGKNIHVVIFDKKASPHEFLKSQATAPFCPKTTISHGTNVTSIIAQFSECKITMLYSSDECREHFKKIADTVDMVNISMSASKDLAEYSWGFLEQYNLPVFVSSGNDGDDEINYPSAFPWTISVGAYSKGRIATYSNYSNLLDCVGYTDIYIWNSEKQNHKFNGTSCSSPQIVSTFTHYAQFIKDNYNRKVTRQEAFDFIHKNCITTKEDEKDGYGLFKLPSQVPVLEKPKEPNPPIEIKPIPEKPKEDIKEPEIIIEEPIIGGNDNMPKYKIVINAGHGKKNIGTIDVGAVGVTGYKEYIETKELADLVSVKLKFNGIETLVIQDGDLWDVTNLANNWKADYFISIHCNSVSDPSAHGVETFSLATVGKGRLLAQEIHKELIPATGLYDRQLKTANYHVLMETNMPAILTEVGFLSNSKEEALMKDPAWDEKVSNAIAKGICNFLGIQYVKQNNNQGGEDMLDVAILLYSKEDYWAGTDVSDKNGNCAIFIRPADKSVPKDAMNSKKLFVIGGETVKHPNEILLSGSNKYGTAQAVYSYLQGK